jgi:hypothetical protein
LTGHNIIVDSDHCIQLVDFNPVVLEVGENEMESEDGTQLVGFPRKGWTLEGDIEGFASILFELIFWGTPDGEVFIPTGIPDFVSRIIESGLSLISGRSSSFNTILEILKQNDFWILDGVDSAEISAFVSWVESTEGPEKSTESLDLTDDPHRMRFDLSIMFDLQEWDIGKWDDRELIE